MAASLSGEASHPLSVRTCPNCGHATRDDDRFCASCGQPTDPRRQGARPASEERSRRSSVAASQVGAYTRSLRRFWWVLVIGLVVALFAGLSARYSVSLFPPGLSEKDAVTYTAESRILVSSAENPYIRAQKTTFVDQNGNPEQSGGEGSSGDAGSEEEPTADGASIQSIPLVSAPDLNTLVRTANLYPFIIESDSVADYRRQKYGDLPGSLSALGVTSVVTANRIELSEIPVLKLIGVAGSNDDAVALADKTAKAFISWLEEQQNDARPRILPEDRIVVQQLTIPRAAIASAGPSTTLPVLVFLVVFAAFCVLAVLLDRLLPARPERSDIEPVEPVKVKKTA